MRRGAGRLAGRQPCTGEAGKRARQPARLAAMHSHAQPSTGEAGRHAGQPAGRQLSSSSGGACPRLASGHPWPCLAAPAAQGRPALFGCLQRGARGAGARVGAGRQGQRRCCGAAQRAAALTRGPPQQRELKEEQSVQEQYQLAVCQIQARSHSWEEAGEAGVAAAWWGGERDLLEASRRGRRSAARPQQRPACAAHRLEPPPQRAVAPVATQLIGGGACRRRPRRSPDAGQPLVALARRQVVPRQQRDELR